MPVRTRVLATCTLSLLLTVAAAACTKSDEGQGVASMAGSATPSATPNLSFQEQGRRHAQCMREHGVPEADPQILPDGTVRVGGGYDKKELDNEVLKSAIEACKPYEPILTGADGERKMAGAREYSRCMRAQGVEDFPDPDANGRLDLPPEQTDPDYDQARAFCRAQPQSSPTLEASRR
jgi:hypothetical protein